MQSEIAVAPAERAAGPSPHPPLPAGEATPLARLLEHVDAGVAWMDADGRFALVNPRYADLLDLRPEDLVGRAFWEFTHPEDRPAEREGFRRLLSGDEPRSEGGKRCLRADGRPVRVEGTVSAARDADGRIVGFAATLRPASGGEPDAPGRVSRAADRAARLQQVTAAIALAWTPEEVARVVVTAGCAALGAAAGKLSVLEPDGRTLRVVQAEGFDDRRADEWAPEPLELATPLTDSVRRGAPIFYSTAAEREARWGGPSRWGFESAAVIPLAVERRRLGGWALGFRESRGFDAEERAFLLALAAQAAQALDRARLYEAEREARQLAERAVERTLRLQAATAALSAARTPAEVAATALAQGVAALAATAGTVALLDDSTRTLVTTSSVGFPDAVVSQWGSYPVDTATLLPHIARTGRPAFFASMADVVARFPAVDAVVTGVRAEATAALPFVADGRVLGVMGLSLPAAHEFSSGERDFLLALAQLCGQALERARLYEAERRARAEAEGANRAKADFLAVMSHELRTPLNAIAGYTELMQLGIPQPLPEPLRPYLDRIQRSQRHLLGLIEDVLGFAQLEAGKVEFHPAHVTADALLQRVEPLVAPQVAARGLVYLCDPCAPGLSVYADVDKAAQILLNLVGNAVKHTPSGGRITLAAEAVEGGVAFRVRDTGSGIPADRLESIFEPFVQVDRRLTGTQGGVGLGLAISRDLARGMGGTLTAESRVGEGSTFTLTLPGGATSPEI